MTPARINDKIRFNQLLRTGVIRADNKSIDPARTRIEQELFALSPLEKRHVVEFFDSGGGWQSPDTLYSRRFHRNQTDAATSTVHIGTKGSLS